MGKFQEATSYTHADSVQGYNHTFLILQQQGNTNLKKRGGGGLSLK